MLTQFAVLWGDTKIAIEEWLDLSPDALHIHAGILVWLALAWLLRRPLSDWRPWLGLFVLEVANEIVDLNQPVGSVESNWPASQHDILNTMFVPTLLMLFLWLAQRRGRWRKR